MRKRGSALALVALAAPAALIFTGCGSSSSRSSTVTVTVTSSTSTSQPSTQTQQTTSTSASQVGALLGAGAFAPNGKGFGTPAPSTIFNGGDPSGLVSGIHWTGWGNSVAIGDGMSSIFKPGGGYYPQLVAVQLRADQLGSCGGPPAYQHLSVREPSAPGGALGPWMPWGGSGNICSAP